MDSNQKYYEMKWYENVGIQILKEGSVPKHVAFIMDGNRRFAQQSKLPKIKGHEQGFLTLLKCLLWCKNLGVKMCTIFAFSIENFNREKAEVDYLMNLAGKQLKKLAQNKNFFQSNEIQVKICGDLSLCTEEIRNSMKECEDLTKHNNCLKLNVCFSYNFTNELEQCMKIVSDKYDLNQISQKKYESVIMENLMIDNEPDLLIRTSNEVRLSNFLLLQARKKTVIFFEKKNWPQIGILDFCKMILHYQTKMRQ